MPSAQRPPLLRFDMKRALHRNENHPSAQGRSAAGSQEAFASLPRGGGLGGGVRGGGGG